MPPKRAQPNKRPLPSGSNADGVTYGAQRPAKKKAFVGKDQGTQTDDSLSDAPPRDPFRTPPAGIAPIDSGPSPENKPRRFRAPRAAIPTSPAAEFMNKCRAAKVPVYSPGQLEYERSVSSTNLLYRFTRPDCVVQPRHQEDVVLAVRACREHRLGLTVRGGSHSYAGFATTDTGVLMDMHRMHGTHLDMESGVMYVQAGARWADVYKRIINGRHNGYVLNGGRCPTVGVSGYLMGAGLGPFTRQLGMGSDSVVDITVVTADGETLHVSEDDPRHSFAGQLFWGLRGAGGGNFGVVVQWKLRVEKLQDPCGLVTSGRYVWSYDANRPPENQPRPPEWHQDNVVSIMSGFYAYKWPDRITIDTTWVHQAGDGRGTDVRFITYCDGDHKYFSEHIDAAFSDPRVRNQMKRRCIEEKSSRFLHETLAAQWSEETVRMIPTATQFRLYAGFGIDNENSMSGMNKLIVIIMQELDRFGELFRGEQAECSVSFIHTGGAARRRSRCLTPYRWRRTNYQAYIQVTFTDKFLERCMRGFLAKFKAQLKPHSVAQQAVFVNFPDAALPEGAFERAYYGKNLLKLRQVKKLVDPADFFRGPQSVRLPDDDEDAATALARADVELAASGHEPEPAPEPRHHQAAYDDEEALTDKLATEHWDKQGDVPTSEFQHNAVKGCHHHFRQNYPVLQPGTRAKDIEFYFDKTG